MNDLFVKHIHVHIKIVNYITNYKTAAWFKKVRRTKRLTYEYIRIKKRRICNIYIYIYMYIYMCVCECVRLLVQIHNEQKIHGMYTKIKIKNVHVK